MPGLVPGSGQLRTQRSGPASKAKNTGGKASWRKARTVISATNQLASATAKPSSAASKQTGTSKAAPNVKPAAPGKPAVPTASSSKSPVSTIKPSVSTVKTSVSSCKPSESSSKPPVSSTKPSVSTVKTSVSSSKPSVSSSKPSASSSKPLVSLSKPFGPLPPIEKPSEKAFDFDNKFREKKHGTLPALSRPPRPTRSLPSEAGDLTPDPGPSKSSDGLRPESTESPCSPPTSAGSGRSARPRPTGCENGAADGADFSDLGHGRRKPNGVAKGHHDHLDEDPEEMFLRPTRTPEGKTAWQERARELGDRDRRPSACEAGINHRVKSTEARRRWMRRNRIHDSAYGGSSSDEDDIPFPFGHESAAANALLYVGLGTVAVGMVIAFVGTGEKGFKTLELRLIGPTLIAGGVLCCLLRVMLCVCPSKCLLKRFRQRSRHKKQIMALEAAGRIALGPMGRSIPPRHSHHRPGSRTSRPGSRTSRPGSRTGSRPPSRLSRAPSELIRSPSDPNDPTVSGAGRSKKRVSIASAGGGAGVHRPGSGSVGMASGVAGMSSSQSSQVLAATSLFLQNEQQTQQASKPNKSHGFTVPSINLPSLPSLVRGRTSSEDLGDSYVVSGVRRLSQSSKRLGSTGDLPLLTAVDIDVEPEVSVRDGCEAMEMGSCSFNSAFSPDVAQPGPSRPSRLSRPSTAPSSSHVYAPHAIIVTSPTPSSSPRPAARSAGNLASGSDLLSSQSTQSTQRDRPTREIILSPGGLGMQ